MDRIHPQYRLSEAGAGVAPCVPTRRIPVVDHARRDKSAPPPPRTNGAKPAPPPGAPPKRGPAPPPGAPPKSVPPIGAQPSTRRNIGARGDTLPGSPPDGAGPPLAAPSAEAHPATDVRFAKGAGRRSILAKDKTKTSRGRRLLQRAISLGEEDAGAAMLRQGQEMAGYGNAELQDGDIVAFFQPDRKMYWTCEDSTIGGSCAIKLKRRGRKLGEGNKFRVVMLDGTPSNERFALKSLYNDKLIAPNIRGRLHCDVAHACDGAALDETTLFTATHNERAVPQTDTSGGGETCEKLPIVRIRMPKGWKWVTTIDSLVHRDPRIGLVGTFFHIAHVASYKVRMGLGAIAAPACRRRCSSLRPHARCIPSYPLPRRMTLSLPSSAQLVFVARGEKIKAQEARAARAEEILAAIGVYES